MGLYIPVKRYIKTVNLKIVRYSSINKSEIIYYDHVKEIFKGLGPLYKNGGSKKGSCTDKEKIKSNQELANYRAKSKLKKLIVENALIYHCVTTYKDSLKDRENTLKEN